MNYKELLEAIGLSKDESAIYVALIELGPAMITDIAHKANIHRPAVYKAIPSLMRHGLVSVFPKGKRRWYVAEPPERLSILLSDMEQKMSGLVPQLRAIYASREKKPLVKFLQGKQGITSVFEDLVTSLGRGEVFYRFSSVKDLKKANSYLPKDYRIKRDQKQLQRFVITSAGRAAEIQTHLDRSIKVLPESRESFSYDVTQVIFGTKVALIDYNSDTVIIIENEVVAAFQKRLFMELYTRI